MTGRTREGTPTDVPLTGRVPSDGGRSGEEGLVSETPRMPRHPLSCEQDALPFLSREVKSRFTPDLTPGTCTSVHPLPDPLAHSGLHVCRPGPWVPTQASRNRPTEDEPLNDPPQTPFSHRNKGPRHSFGSIANRISDPRTFVLVVGISPVGGDWSGIRFR